MLLKDLEQPEASTIVGRLQGEENRIFYSWLQGKEMNEEGLASAGQHEFDTLQPLKKTT